METIKNRLYSTLAEERGIVIPGIFDPLSAKIAELCGFHAAWVSGFCVSTSLFLPDENYMTIDQYANRIYEIRRVSNIPLIIDCDEGYGSISNTLEFFEKLSNIGVESCCLEDNTFPKINSFKECDRPREILVNENIFAEKIFAIKERFPGLILIARTESLIVGEDITKAIQRASIYKQAGADYIVIHSKFKRLQEFERIIQFWKDPQSLIVIPTLAEDLLFNDLITLGFKIVILANQVLRGTINTMYNVYRKISDDSGINELNRNTVTMSFIFDLVDAQYKKRQSV